MTTTAEYAEKIKETRRRIEENHLAGAGGMDSCRAWSSFVDDLICEIVDSKSSPEKDNTFALIALGGYGRGELNPYSDIDLLFLYEKVIIRSGDSAHMRVIPLLWDLGFKVGHSTRTISDCLKIADHDSVSRTSMIEARFLLGNRDLFNMFSHRFKTRIVQKKVVTYLRDKRSETELRHEKFHNTLFLTEPDVKESPGGLRDYHIGLWAASARYGTKTIREIEQRGLIEHDEALLVTDSVNLILKVRNELHFLTKGPHDQLDYGLQTMVAKRLGYGGDENASVVRMMREYYRAADTLYRFGQSLMERASRHRTRSQLFLLKLRHKEVSPYVFAGPEEIYVKEMKAKQLSVSPEKVFTILKLIAEKELNPTPGLRRMLYKVGRIWKQDKPDNFHLAGEGFRLLMNTREPAAILRLMRDCRLLTAMIPEFYSIRYLTPFDLYHRFTVDDHSFLAVRELDNLKRNDDPDCDMLRMLYEEEKRKDLLRLAILLHDIGKGDGNHGQEPDMDPKIVERLGYAESDVKLIQKLVQLHILMSRVSQHRDAHDEKTVSEFCKKVGDAETIKRLYLLTFADMSAVGPGVWNSWRGTLLKDLYTKSMEYLKGEDPLKKATPGRFLPKEELTDDVLVFVKGMPKRYFQIRSPEQVINDAALFSRLAQSEQSASVQYEAASAAGPGKLTIMARDRAGLLHSLVGTLSSKNVDILEAQVLTHRVGTAVDIFRVNGPNDTPINDQSFWQRIETEITKVLDGKNTVDDLIRSRQKLMAAIQNLPAVDPMVKLLNDVSTDYTVIETTSRDRMVLLYDITRTLNEEKIRIVSARISTEGHRAVDVFYATQSGGTKITNPEKISEIKKQLLNIIAR
ncbi:MAG: bifunctional uridylyltransferase/uridylyl-removing enzyme [bacterium]|nr:MAG: bifunctional uridylyltransferase/uridylyl-removing enzyme [bacterium]